MHDANKEGADGAPTSAAGQQIHMRCLIVTQDASIIIGKGGSHVNEIREKSGAKVMVSESIPGNPERILNVSGALDAVSKVRWPLSAVYYIYSLTPLDRHSVSLFAVSTTSLSTFHLSLEAELSPSNSLSRTLGWAASLVKADRRSRRYKKPLVLV